MRQKEQGPEQVMCRQAWLIGLPPDQLTPPLSLLNPLRMSLTLFSPLKWLGGLIFLLSFVTQVYAQESFARGMVIFGATATEPSEYHQAALFKSYQPVAAWYEFDIGGTRPLRVERGHVIKLIEFDALDRRGVQSSVFTMDIVSDDDARVITGIQNALSDAASRSPKVKKVVDATNEALGKLISEFRSGRVRFRGEWMERSAMTTTSAPSTGSPVLSISGQQYHRARLMFAKDGMVTLAHDGGVAKIPLSSLNAQEQQRLAASLQFDLAKAGAAPRRAENPSASSEPVLGVLEIDAHGAGTSFDDALKDALRDAVRRAVGTFISTEQVVKNDELIRDEVVAYSDAFVKGYDKTAEKHEAGLFQISIRAKVERSKLSEKLTSSGLIGKTELKGENMFAEAITKLDKASAAKDLLTKLFSGFPHKFCKPQLIGNPAITGQTETTATLRLRVRISVDPQAYGTWYQEAAKVLGQVCSGKKPFSIPRVEVREPQNVREHFQDKLYDDKPPTANDDPSVARFNPKLDGLVPVLKSSYLGLQIPRTGLVVGVSRSSSGFNGDFYILGADEATAVTSSLQQGGQRGEDAWRKLDRVEVRFLDDSGEQVRLELLDLQTRHLEDSEKWLAPYEALYGDSDTKLSLINRPLYEDERVMLIQPSFLLLDRSFDTLPTNRGDAGIATTGVAFDFSLELPLEEVRTFRRLELAWPREE